jgi:hypothetical protein
MVWRNFFPNAPVASECKPAACARPATGYTYAPREPDKTALFQVIQQHLLTFEQQWTDQSDGRTLPSFVTDELHDFLALLIAIRTEPARREEARPRRAPREDTRRI